MIHLVTALDQQMSVMEGKLARSLAEGERGRPVDITRDEVIRMVRDGQQNHERGEIILERHHRKYIKGQFSDAQVQSMVEEVQKMMGQVRELGLQVREAGDRVRRVQGETNENTERFGVELAEAVSRVETVRESVR